MKTSTRTTLPLLTLCLIALALSACSDALVAEEQAPAAKETISKLRHAHLFADPGAGKILDRYEDAATYTDFILGLSPVVLDMQRILDRYEDDPDVTVTRTFRRSFKGFSIHVNSGAVNRLLNLIEADTDILWAEPDARVNNGSPGQTTRNAVTDQTLPWNIDHIDADISSTISGDRSGSVSGVEIFIFDSGIKKNDATVDVELDYTSSGSVSDNVGHGTHVTGIAAADDNWVGVVGVAPGATVHNLKVLDNNGQTELSTVIAAIEYVNEQKEARPSVPMIVNISFGADIGTTQYNALDLAVAESIQQGVVYVIAAGNEGIDASTVTPAHVAEAITVGAYDQNNAFASFSNYGPMVDLLAPGVDILSSSNANGAKKPPVEMSGTSMAAPHVTGTAALYLSQHPDATPSEVWLALLSSARDWVTGEPQYTTSLSVYAGDF